MRWMAVPVLVLTLVACGGGDDDAGSSIDAVTTTAPETTAPETTAPAPTTTDAPSGGGGGGGAATTAPAETTTVPTTAPPTTAPAPTTVPPTTAAPTPGECLVGNWVITQDEMNAFYDTLEATVDAPLDITVSGQTLLDLTADTYLYTANFDLTVDVAGQSGTGQSTGTVSGTYSAVDGVIVTTLGSSDLNVIISVMGQTIDGSSMANGWLTAAPINDSPYDCSGPTPVIMFETADPGVRHPVTLTPA
ncbi:MAG: hypothetical protein RIB65_19740 [Ilumatobacter fluminis]|uniref:hypothetical protein n=1 Tax=Ilumatobacter fluminis TaxID=467091 RepID=UPI0032F03B7E